MSLDETVIYQLMECINELKREIIKLQGEIVELRRKVVANTDAHSN